MPETISYTNFQIISKVAGSPAVNYIFNDNYLAVMIDNLSGGSPIYVNFDTTADATGSADYLIPGGEWRSFALKTGTVSIQGSGGLAPLVNVMGIR